jgi:glutamine---fructose-6-phosphate transaminase (isomerizing)
MMKKDAPGFNVIKEMFEASGTIRNFNPEAVKPFARLAEKYDVLFLAGEGSSRMFPAGHAAWLSLMHEGLARVFSAGSTEALLYELKDCAVFAATNSGRTKETVRLLKKLGNEGHKGLFAITGSPGTPVVDAANMSYILSCGMEKAIPATKSLIEQALFYHALLFEMAGISLDGLHETGKTFEESLSQDISPKLVKLTAEAPFIYFAGWNNGVAEELSLKAGELLRKKTRYLDGTLLLHGIEEIMDRGELVVLIDPYEEEEAIIRKRLEENIGVNVIAISERQTIFPGIPVAEAPGFECYIQMAAVWNLLVKASLMLGLDIDHPARVKKVGNVY